MQLYFYRLSNVDERIVARGMLKNEHILNNAVRLFGRFYHIDHNIHTHTQETSKIEGKNQHKLDKKEREREKG